ncbi:MAG: hypothetical protein H6684_07195 [Deltaproteobacteria bacterium]|nr:hypothetical protein [bacterium]MCB9475499.1 hypothetical protein [Deltaproteobacteria bacterium]MCB9488498.1 hypothetical protein [Deltaproteobacteria bacterium]
MSLRFRPGIVAVLALALVMGLAATASAQDTAPPTKAGPEKYIEHDPHWFESPRNFSTGFNIGLAFPESNDIKDVYGEKGDVLYVLQGGWRFWHEFELHAELGYVWFQGRGLDSNGDKTSEKFKIHIAPADLHLLYRLQYWYDQPIVPFVGAGGSAVYWFEEQLDSSNKERGINTGYSAQAGVMFLLDKLEKRASGRLERDYGINNTYFFYQFKYAGLDDFGGDKDKTLDLSYMSHTFGVLFQF